MTKKKENQKPKDEAKQQCELAARHLANNITKDLWATHLEQIYKDLDGIRNLLCYGSYANCAFQLGLLTQSIANNIEDIRDEQE